MHVEGLYTNNLIKLQTVCVYSVEIFFSDLSSLNLQAYFLHALSMTSKSQEEPKILHFVIPTTDKTRSNFRKTQNIIPSLRIYLTSHF